MFRYKEIYIILLYSLLILWSNTGFAQPVANHGVGNAYPQIYQDVAPVCKCENLLTLDIPNTVIQSAEVDTDGSYCLVTAIVNHPPANDEVNVWTALPLKNWNGRFYGTGGGGFKGGGKRSLSTPVEQGFAAGATDTGHEGGKGSFALDTVNGYLNWQLIRDNAYLGIHDMTVVGKELVKAFYRKPAAFSYFVGTSTGGRQGLMEAQRYPEDYNGILSGCPAINWSYFVPSDIWPQVVMQEENNFVSNEKLVAVTKAVVDAVDGDDGMVDGIIDDPINCKWDPKNFIGATVGESNFTEADAKVVRKIWEGPHSINGKKLWYGLTRGTNLTTLAGTKGIPLTGKPFKISLEWYRYFLILNPKFEATDLDYSRFELFFNQSVEQFTEVIGTNNPDLTAFRDHGGKLIVLHGLSDEQIYPQGTIEYFERVKNFMGGIENTNQFARLFLFPGLDHGFRGEAPKPTGQVEALINWVENGIAPESILGELHDKSGIILRTKRILPYPYSSYQSGNENLINISN